MLDIARHEILHLHTNSNFHGCSEDAVHAGPQHDELSDVNRMKKTHMIYGGSNDRTAGVPDGSQRRGKIHQVHDLAAQNIT